MYVGYINSVFSVKFTSAIAGTIPHSRVNISSIVFVVFIVLVYVVLSRLLVLRVLYHRFRRLPSGR